MCSPAYSSAASFADRRYSLSALSFSTVTSGSRCAIRPTANDGRFSAPELSDTGYESVSFSVGWASAA